MEEEINTYINEVPKPEILAIRSTNRTIPTSLRVREDTYNYFVKLAEKYDTTPTSVINELLNSYADIGRKRDERLIAPKADASIKIALRKELSSFEQKTDVELLTIVYRITEKNSNDEELVKKAEDTINQVQKNDASRENYCLGITGCPVMCTSDRYASAEGARLYVPSRDWPMVAAVVMTYFSKNKDFDEKTLERASLLRRLEMQINRSVSRGGLINRITMVLETYTDLNDLRKNSKHYLSYDGD